MRRVLYVEVCVHSILVLHETEVPIGEAVTIQPVHPLTHGDLMRVVDVSLAEKLVWGADGRILFMHNEGIAAIPDEGGRIDHLNRSSNRTPLLVAELVRARLQEFE